MAVEKIVITPLGSMGWIPVRDRHTCCYCVEYKDRLILLDAGTGVARFSEPALAAIADKYDKVYIFLSHYHLDHIAGLIYLPHFFKGKEVHIAGPGKAIYGTDIKKILTIYTAYPFFSRSITDFPMDIRFHNLRASNRKIDGLHVETFLQRHSDPSLGIKIEDALCYSTDTANPQDSAYYALNSRVLLHESWYDSKEYRELFKQLGSSPDARKAFFSHSSVEEVAQMASNMRVEALMLIHLNPDYSPRRLAAMEKQAQAIFPNSFLAQEGKSLEISMK